MIKREKTFRYNLSLEMDIICEEIHTFFTNESLPKHSLRLKLLVSFLVNQGAWRLINSNQAPYTPSDLFYMTVKNMGFSDRFLAKRPDNDKS